MKKHEQFGINNMNINYDKINLTLEEYSFESKLSFAYRNSKNNIRKPIPIDKEELKKNEILLDSVLFRLIQISENIHKLPEDFKREHDTIPWKEISGFRNRIVHDYGNVDIRVVYYVVANDLPQLKYLFEKLITQQT